MIGHLGNSAGSQLTDASGNTYSFDTGGGRGQVGQSWVFWNTRVGTPDQPAEYPLQNQQDPNWKPSCTLSGRAYSYLNLVWDQTRFSNGIPGIRVDVDGKADIYDPRVDVRGAITISQGALNVITGLQFPVWLNGANIVIEGASPGVEPNGQPGSLIATLAVDANGTITPAASGAVTNALAVGGGEIFEIKAVVNLDERRDRYAVLGTGRRHTDRSVSMTRRVSLRCIGVH